MKTEDVFSEIFRRSWVRIMHLTWWKFLRARPNPSPSHWYPIVQGSSQYTIEGRAVALDGMKTACGASLIASQQEFLASE
nr:PAAR domain-containing protein [Burkholderia contaminans]